MRRAELPVHLPSAFSVSDAADAGVSPSRLRGADLEMPFRGMRVRKHVGQTDEDGSGAEARRMRERALQYAVVMPERQLFTHATAAVLWQLPLPRSLWRVSGSAATDVMRLDVGVFAPARTPRGRAIRGHQLHKKLATAASTDGARLTSPASTWAAMGSTLSVHDLVALGDAIVREPMFRADPAPLATIPQLAAAVDAGRRPGIARLQQALPLIRTRSASEPETRCRLLFVDAGLGEPRLNWNVSVDGRFVACVDLAYPDLRIAIEYEGLHHLHDARQWAKDIERHECLRELGWIVIRVTAQQLRAHPQEVVERVRRAVASRR
jgi:very-short-patch-repair endonuclease